MKTERSATTCAVCGDLFDMNKHEKEAGRMPQCAPCSEIHYRDLQKEAKR